MSAAGRIAFHGAAGTVTGSRTLVESGDGRVLIDAGLFQGTPELRDRNWDPPPFEPSSLDAVLLTHAHIDHSGWLPRLVKLGFRGPVFATPATADLADVMLRDSAMIQEEDAEYANKKGYTRHRPALPLYTLKDAERAIGRIEVRPYGQWERVAPDARMRYAHAGHLLGSGTIELEIGRDAGARRVLFSGDVGRYGAPLVPDPSPPPACDVLVVESTYGDRLHPGLPVEGQIEALLARVRETEGTLVVAAFAVGRSQQLLWYLHRVMERDPRLAMPVHLDSPMAIDTTRIYARYPEERGLEALDLRSGSSVLYTSAVYLHRTRDESVRLNALVGPRVIVSSSGMMTGGRVLHHLRRLLPDEQNVVALAGYQAPGTRGDRLQRGERSLRIHGRDVAIRARVESVSGLSAHADREELVRWLRDLAPPRRTYINHGEPDASRALAAALERELGFACRIPSHGEVFDVD